jgi:hypothetical protein
VCGGAGAHCEESANTLLELVTLKGGAHWPLDQMLDALELSALYTWLGRHGEAAVAE